jgi:hypothetical protein
MSLKKSFEFYFLNFSLDFYQENSYGFVSLILTMNCFLYGCNRNECYELHSFFGQEDNNLD